MSYIELMSDLPFPKSNIQIYKNIYWIEQWLRRIAYSCLMVTYGESWVEKLSPEIANEIKKRRGNIKSHLLFDCESNCNILWLSTLEELKKILMSEQIWTLVNELTGFTKAELNNKTTMIREVRNIISHNRATTIHTYNILREVQMYLRKGIDVFYQRFHFEGIDDVDEIDYDSCFTIDGPDNTIMYGTKDKYFTKVTSLPVRRKYNFLAIDEVIEITNSIKNEIIAITINIDGDEFSLVSPGNISDSFSDEMIFKLIECERKAWTKDAYFNQSEKYICDPQIWFYGNQPPNNGATSTNDKEDHDSNVLSFPSIMK